MKRVFRVIVFLIYLFEAGFVDTQAQQIAVKTNALYWGTTTPNAGLEWRLAPRYTFSSAFGYNAVDLPDAFGAEGSASNPKINHWMVMPEFKYWFCNAFERGYLGFHALYGGYNVGGLKFPSVLGEFRYKGRAAGAGVGYGYQWALGGRWGLEGSLGLGYVYLWYDKYTCGSCGDKLGGYRRHYLGPTKAALSLIYHIQ